MTKFEQIKESMKRTYLSQNIPFIIGFSGGKDSTVTLQLFWQALQELPKDQLRNKIYVITTDTMVEQPFVLNMIHDHYEYINDVAAEQKLPIESVILKPKISQTFWVNFLGRGYGAPNQRTFRWCTSRLKIDPVNKFILNQVNESGEAIIVLGARKNESISRGQGMNKRSVDEYGLSKHPSLNSAKIFTPIENLTANEVWDFLLSNPETPWGSSNRNLAALYKNASDSECPLVIDNRSKSCGQSRFGCWICTLVSSDTSMENLIDSGESWMIPMLELRNLIKETADPDKKHIYRTMKGRDGKIKINRDGDKIVRRSIRWKWKKEFLRQLLIIQRDLSDMEGGIELITLPELHEIRKLWKLDNYDWEDSVSKIFLEVFGTNFLQLHKSVTFNTDDVTLLKEISDSEDLPFGLISKLLMMEMDSELDEETRLNRIDEIFSEEWRTEEQIEKDFEPHRLKVIAPLFHSGV